MKYIIIPFIRMLIKIPIGIFAIIFFAIQPAIESLWNWTSIKKHIMIHISELRRNGMKKIRGEKLLVILFITTHQFFTGCLG